MNPLFLRALLASLPVLGFALQMENGFIYGVLGSAVFLLSGLGFFLVEKILHRSIERIGFYLLLLALMVLAQRFFSVSLLLLVSTIILTPAGLFKKGKNKKPVLSRIIFSSFFFFVVLSFHGALTEWLGTKAGILFFQNPSGSYFLAGLSLTFLSKKKEPKK